MNKDLIDDRFGRFREIPLELARMGHRVTGLCLSYRPRARGWISDGTVLWRSVNAGRLKFFGLSCFMAQAQRLAKGGDVIWACSDSFYGIIGHVLSRRYGIPFVFDLYDNFEYYLIARLPVLKQLYRWVIRECDVVTCVSKPLERLVRSYGRHGPVYVMENAVRKEALRALATLTDKDSVDRVRRATMELCNSSDADIRALADNTINTLIALPSDGVAVPEKPAAKRLADQPVRTGSTMLQAHSMLTETPLSNANDATIIAGADSIPSGDVARVDSIDAAKARKRLSASKEPCTPTHATWSRG